MIAPVLLQIFQFLLYYSDHLLYIHQVIQNAIEFIINALQGKVGESFTEAMFEEHTLSYADNGFRDGQITWLDLLKALHIILLNVLHYYLLWSLFSSKAMSGAPPAKWLRVLQWISLFILTLDWLVMDTMMVVGRDEFGWFRTAGMFFLWAHSVPVFALLGEKFRTNYTSAVSVSSAKVEKSGKASELLAFETYDAVKSWKTSYLIFGAVFLVAAVTGTVSWAFKAILASTSPIAVNLSSGFLLAYTVAVFYGAFPRITNTFSRPFSLFSLVFMGGVMGLCDALVLSMAYRLAVAIIGLQNSNVALLIGGTLFAYLVPTAFYYAAIFNPKLAPEHRRPEWDGFKISTLVFADVFAVVFVIYTQSWLVVYINQILCLSGIIYSMRFPSPWWKEPDLA
jgi:hypothetical protein